MTKDNILRHKSFEFSIKIVKFCAQLNEQKNYVLAKQLLRSGTSIGALVRESKHAESKKDFIHKLQIAQKEAEETGYWIDLLFHSELLEESIYNDLRGHCEELIRILTSILKTLKSNNNKGENLD